MKAAFGVATQGAAFIMRRPAPFQSRAAAACFVSASQPSITIPLSLFLARIAIRRVINSGDKVCAISRLGDGVRAPAPFSFQSQRED
jgi:hypothetical protein